MVEIVVFSSLFSSGGGCLWWLVINVGDLDNFCSVFMGCSCVFVRFFFHFFGSSKI